MIIDQDRIEELRERMIVLMVKEVRGSATEEQLEELRALEKELGWEDPYPQDKET